jgi:hypothetical protein
MEEAVVTGEGDDAVYTCCEDLVVNNQDICVSQCEDYCATNQNAAWENKCNWIACTACPECGAGEACGEYGEDAHLSDDGSTYTCCDELVLNNANVCITTCEPYCATNSNPWDSKCNWAACTGCGDCAAEPEPESGSTTITFNVQFPEGISEGQAAFIGGGSFGGPDGVALSDDDGDGIWSATEVIASVNGDSMNHFFTILTCADWGCKENVACQSCGYADDYNDRQLTAIDGGAQTVNICYGSCDGSACVDGFGGTDDPFVAGVQAAGFNTHGPACDDVPQHDVTFNVDTATIDVGPNGMFLGGGIIGDAQAQAMSDDDGDGIWSVTVSFAEGTSGN